MKNSYLKFDNDQSIIRISLLFFILASIFSLGFHHADEHYQILEFAGSKLGLIDVKDLPWEYEARIRTKLYNR